MKPVDDLILEFVESYGQSTPKMIAEEIERHPNYVGSRCRELRDRGLLRNIARGLYQITDVGEGYLSGDIDAGEINNHGGEVETQ